MNPLLPFGAANPHAEVTLFCLPHAGAGASCYRSWVRGAFPPWIDVRPVQLPGREGLWREALIDDATSLATHLADRLRAEFDRPFVIYGHSMGGLLAAELTALLGHRRMLPRLLVVSGYSRTGTVPNPARHDIDLFEWLLELGGTNPDVLADSEMRSLVLPVLRADLNLAGTYTPVWTTLPVPILAFCGTTDPVADSERMEDWRTRSEVGADVVSIEGGHFFNQERLSEVSVRIIDRLICEGSE